MSNSARSVTIFGIYLVLSGLSFILIPNILLPTFGLATTTEVWVRVVGLVALILGVYFLNSARANDRRFFRDTVLGRVMFCTGVILFVMAGWGSPVLILFGLIDLAGAAWTWSALRRESAV
jgi:uncharacterized membrane protein